MHNLQALGIRPDDLLDPLPDLSPQAQLAVACWHFCDGWAPERWPVFAAFHDVPDWGALVDLMQAIRAEQVQCDRKRSAGRG